ncbi:MAG: ATP-binding cassette domain-containing protein [Tepidiformaceae bacterium]
MPRPLGGIVRPPAGTTRHDRRRDRLCVLADANFALNRGGLHRGADRRRQGHLTLHLNGIQSPSHGSITIAGIGITKQNLGRIRAEVGLAFQDSDDHLVTPTVFEDVAFGPLHMGVPAEEIQARVERSLAAAGLSGFERRLPHHPSRGQRKTCCARNSSLYGSISSRIG